MNTPLLSLNNVSLITRNSERPILQAINYQINSGDFVIILGSNGSGKSSILKLLSRQYLPSAGQIELEQTPLPNHSPKQFSKLVKLLTQNSHETLFSNLSILENYLLFKQQYQSQLFALKQRKDMTFFADYLQEFNPNLSEKLHQTVEQLSGGEKQALALALTVLYPPKILLLDEHTSALDPNAASRIMLLTQKIARKHSITCILTTHDLKIAHQFGNRIWAIKEGKTLANIDHDRKQNMDQTKLLETCY